MNFPETELGKLKFKAITASADLQSFLPIIVLEFPSVHPSRTNCILFEQGSQLELIYHPSYKKPRNSAKKKCL